jgi:hypothetical protein
MKRQTEDDAVVLPMKKRTSSLFSINTIHESENDKSSSNCNSASSSTVGLDLMAKDESQSTSTTVLKTLLEKGTSSQDTKAVSAPPLSSTEDSSCTEDEQDDTMSLTNGSFIKPSLTTMNCQRAANKRTDANVVKEVICEPKEEHQNGKCNHINDLRSGIVFEAGFSHFDPHNRLHKERPIRITSIMEHLKKGGNDIYSRCCVLGEEDDSRMSPTQSAIDFLEDEDYLRVHLPGYMKR